MPETYSRLVRLREVMHLTGLSRSTIYAYMKAGKFPAKVLITERLVGWPEDVIQDWISGRLNNSSDLEVKS